ncbi:Crp/Fnr family transcriptional regulator [Streptomyces antibioticus]|uniref:Crp/Fnr family transcriptional regulator n=1 Tax=Streptomyces antibioticus TaxID=1890 RepID=UPI0033A5D604
MTTSGHQAVGPRSSVRARLRERSDEVRSDAIRQGRGGRSPAGRYHWTPGSLLAELPPDAAERFLGLGRPVTFAAGERLISEGSSETSPFLILTGCVKVTSDAQDGGTVLLALRTPGEIVGELAALDDRPRSATVTAVRPTLTRVMTARALREHLRASADASEAMHRAMAAKLRGATRYRVDAASGSATTRVARVLDYLLQHHAQPAPDGLRISVPLSHTDLAALANISDASVQRALRSLRDTGAVTTRYRNVLVREPALLRTIAARETS